MLATKSDAEKDNVVVPLTREEYCIKHKKSEPEDVDMSDFYYDDDYCDDVDEYDEYADDDDDSGNGDS